jgi:hypothetical protein
MIGRRKKKGKTFKKKIIFFQNSNLNSNTIFLQNKEKPSNYERKRKRVGEKR